MTIPTSTYRIQFNPRFTFLDLYNIVDYLAELGITGIYASPLLRPAHGSEHGYDGIDVTCLNPELGTIEDLRKLSKKLKENNIAWIQDIVPNHLAYNTSNVWLNDVLERGTSSPYAGHFDIDWNHPAHPGKLMVPFLGDEVEECIRDKKLTIEFVAGKGLSVIYYNNIFPITFSSYRAILQNTGIQLNDAISTALADLVSQESAEYLQWQDLKRAFLNLITEPLLRRLNDAAHRINDDPAFFLSLLQQQHYVLCTHTESYLQINFRRFFNVNGLICLRIENEVVFQDYHRYIHQLYEEGLIQGLRIDHIDGLRDPHEYIRRLRKLFGEDCYVIVEKILNVKEELPASMSIQGTSGYEFLSYINQVLTDSKGAEQLLAVYKQYVPQTGSYDDIVFRNKLANFETYLNGEWDNLLRYLLSLNLIDDLDIRLPDLKQALGIFMACFPVYRVYIESLPPNINDEQLIIDAFVQASKMHPEYDYHFGILRQLFSPDPDPLRHQNRLLFAQRLMQFTGPLAAKGIEDTTFYQYNPLISHNEVGDQPCVLGIPVRLFHEKMNDRLTKNPLSLNCTSTHDTKRGEDNRVRINILSELAPEWATLVANWQRLNEPFRKDVGEVRAPVINDEYFLYQAITGGFPEDLKVTDAFVQRTKNYFTKVLRESKQMSDHVNPNTAYEQACSDFIDHLLNPDHEFLATLIPFVTRIIDYANTYTMVQVIIKCTAPGIPDIYQGCELWDLSYVDPDNRRAVDYDLRKNLLTTLVATEKESNAAMLQYARKQYAKGAEKLMVTQKLLQLRKMNPDLFSKGEYIPVYSEGSDRIIIAYMRHWENSWLLVILPVGIVQNAGKELAVILPEQAPAEWKNIFTSKIINGRTLDVQNILHGFPVAVFVN